MNHLTNFSHPHQVGYLKLIFTTHYSTWANQQRIGDPGGFKSTSESRFSGLA